ncbi:MAG: DUF2800 domain-containing protein [Alphaproteobacteria bacterium]|nr:MAG: DUF2800 domain-containing protein [Alphaproteobacteria bacterium]
MEMLKYDGNEMMDCAHTYVSVLSHWLLNTDELGEILFYGLEKGIPIFPEDGCFGTSDALIIGTKGCAIIDYKHGKGKNVSADSVQLRTYAAGVARHLIDVPEDYRYYSVVVQPRTDIAPKVALYNHDQMMDHLQIIQQTIQTSKQKDLYPVESNDCFFCPLNQTRDREKKCPAKLGHAITMANENFGKFLSDMNEPIKDLKSENKKRDDAILKIMSLLPLMQKIAKDGEDEFMYRIEAGEEIPGLQVTNKLGNRQWVFDSEDSMKSCLETNFPGVEIFKTKTSLKTITEIEKIVGENKCDGLTLRKSSKKLKILDAKIQEVLGNLANFGSLSAPNEE